MLPGPKRLPPRRRVEVAPIMPPDLCALGTLPFRQTEREILRSWLSEGGWPRGCMDMEMLEGYLVALLVWPVGLPSGAWLPPIWGERGWKVPAKLAAPNALEKFVALVGGFLQELDRGLAAQPPRFVAAIRTPEPTPRWQRIPGCAWAVGFLSALRHNSQGLKYRSDAAKSAATAIARYASMPPTSGTSAELSRAVLALAAERSSRGPLGALESLRLDAALPATHGHTSPDVPMSGPAAPGRRTRPA